MKTLPISRLVPGMITAEDVYAGGNSTQLVLPKGLMLTDSTITKLEFYSIFSIKVESDQVTPPPERDVSFSERVRNSEEFKQFSKEYKEDIQKFETSLNDVVRLNNPLETDVLLANTLHLIQKESGHVNLFDMLTNLRSIDDLTYAHSINVALISNVFAGWLHYSKEDIEMATLCGLLHDIGKIMVDEEILKKPASLTEKEYEIVKTHTIKGYLKLKEAGADIQICNAALMHHERPDGSGYPNGLTGDQISDFAALVSLADVYDAMTSARVYRGPMCPFQVIGLIESEGYQKYSPKFLMTFLENVVNTYLLNTVQLSDGREGTIIFINKDHLARPTVRIGDEYVDLSKNPNIEIARIV